MPKLIIVSNRLPISIRSKKSGYTYEPSVGGLATGLKSFFRTHSAVWVGWPGLTNEELASNRASLTQDLKKQSYQPVYLSKKEYDDFYLGFSNKTIWPLFHYFANFTRYHELYWEAYRRVNKLYAQAVLDIAEPGDRVWIHDYHLMLLPRMVRDRMKSIQNGFFLHIPFPAFEVFRQLPWARDIIQGLIAADVVGFHRYNYVRHFLESCLRFFGYENNLGTIIFKKHVTKIDSFSMGIDYDRFEKAAGKSSVHTEEKKIREEAPRQKTILSVDRMDYTKGILEHLEAYRYFLKTYPSYQKRVTYFMVAVPSRSDIPEYQQLKKQVEELVGKINGEFGTIRWTPVRYLYKALPFNRLVGLYKSSDVAVVTSLRDGMNLVAKEYVASKTNQKGVLILSEMAGTANELGAALEVNPNDIESVGDAFKTALDMPAAEQKDRMQTMQKLLKQYDVKRWAADYMRALDGIQLVKKELQGGQISSHRKRTILKRFHSAKNRLLILDYDGTLVPFAPTPKQAEPDPDLIAQLKKLTSDKRNEVIIISGREREYLQEWFKNPNLNLIAEHGAWIKEKKREWRLIEPMQNDWKKGIRMFMQFAVDRTPRSFIEEKDYALVWHYRMADSKLGIARARELKEYLIDHTAHENLDVQAGNKVIEVKNANMNKGRALQSFLEKKKWDFIFAVGDDVTDEDIFEAVPEDAITCKVGMRLSKARYNVDAHTDVRKLLQTFSRSKPGHQR